MMRKLAFGSFVTGLIVLGMVAQGASYLLALPGSAGTQQTRERSNTESSLVETVSHPVGLRRLAEPEAPLPMTVWYPAVQPDTGATTITYSYALNMLTADSSVALATYAGWAIPAATPDLDTGPYPLVVLSPGFAVASSSYAWLAEDIASHGFVVVSPQHRESLDPGGLWESTVERPEDILSVLTFVDEQVRAGGEFERLIDNETVAVVGHSYGGYTALAAAGARIDTSAVMAACEPVADQALAFLCDALLPRLDDIARSAGLGSVPEGLWPAQSDPRIDAVVALAGDAFVFGRRGLDEVTVPVLAIGGTADTDSPFEWGSELTVAHASSRRKALVALEGARHMVFAGPCEQVRTVMRVVANDFCSDPVWDREQAHEVIGRFTTAFLLAELKGDPEAVETMAQGSSAVTYRQRGYLQDDDSE